MCTSAYFDIVSCLSFVSWKLSFLDLNLSISNDTGATKIYDKRDAFDFDIVIFPFLDGDIPRRTPLWSVCISTFSCCQSIFPCQ